MGDRRKCEWERAGGRFIGDDEHETEWYVEAGGSRRRAGQNSGLRKYKHQCKTIFIHEIDQ
ncbi:hypothetical protein D3C75_1343170 [compost metagenome]